MPVAYSKLSHTFKQPVRDVSGVMQSRFNSICNLDATDLGIPNIELQ